MRYVGSKLRIKKYIIPIINNIIEKNNIEIFIDMFVGGANIIDSIKCKYRIGNDVSKYLIALLKGVQDGRTVEPLTKAQWLEIRENQEDYDDFEIGSAGYLHSYNARFFKGYSGTTKTSEGIRHYHLESIKTLENQNLDGITFTSHDYRETKPLQNVCIYCDIPYKDTIKYEIGAFDHAEFWEWAREFSKNNIVIVSEQTAPEDFVSIWEKPVKRTMSFETRIQATEHLFVHKSLLDKINA